jgi:alpha-methylacyl-CoA racemase
MPGTHDEPPLTGIRIVEFAALGPVPLAGMVLADMGADVLRVQRVGPAELDVIPPDQRDAVLRGRRVIRADLTDSATQRQVGQLIEQADVLIEGFRPGTLERLGFGAEVCCDANPGLIYARMTGWGQDGPASQTAGHDLNYLSVTGALHAIGRRGAPPPVPLNLIGDYGGGSMFLVTGILAALLERGRSGHGQVIDAAMVDGVSALLQPVLSWRSAGQWTDQRASNLLDGAAPFYHTYECSDGRYVAVGAIENRFYAELVDGLDLDIEELPDRADRRNWPRLGELFAATFAQRARDDWAATFSGTDACVTPVLAFDEADADPQLAARGTFNRDHGHLEASPAPRFSRSGHAPGATAVDVDIAAALESWPARE